MSSRMIESASRAKSIRAGDDERLYKNEVLVFTSLNLSLLPFPTYDILDAIMRTALDRFDIGWRKSE